MSVNAEKSTLTVKTIVAGGFTIALAFGGGVWAASGWKTSVDEHLDRMDRHMEYEDRQQEIQGKQLQWLIQHNKDANQAPMDWQHGQLDNPFESVSQAPQTADTNRWR